MKARTLQFLVAALLLFTAAATALGEEVAYVVNSYVHPPDPTWSKVMMVRGKSMAILKTADLWGDDAHSVAVHPDGSHLWVTCPPSNNIAVIDAETFAVVDNLYWGDIIIYSPMGVAFNPDGSRAWITFEETGEIAVYNGNTRAWITNFTIGGRPNFITFTPNGAKAYIVDYQNADVYVVRTSDYALLKVLSFGGVALQDAVVKPDGTRVYVSNMDQNRIEVIRTSDDTALSPILTADIKPRAIGITPDGNYLFVGHYLAVDAKVNMLRLSDQAIVSSVWMPSNPRCMAVRENGTKIYVTEHNENELYAFKVSGESLIPAGVTDLDIVPGYNASPVGVAIGAHAHPLPDIKINGSDGPLYLTTADSIKICLSMNAQGLTDDADWWLIGSAPYGLFFWTPSTGWTPSWLPMYQGPLQNVPNFCSPVTPLAGYPLGRYVFYFAVDVKMDGLANKPWMYWNKIVVNIVE